MFDHLITLKRVAVLNIFRLCLVAFCSFLNISILISQDWETFDEMNYTALIYNQGFKNFQISGNNNGLLGEFTAWDTSFRHSGFKYFQYGYIDNYYRPDNPYYGFSWLEGSPWIGAKLHLNDTSFVAVTTGLDGEEVRIPYMKAEMLGYTKEGDSVWRTSVNVPNKPNRRYFDDDGDSRIDEDELDGDDNDGDWLINRDDLNHNRKPDHGEPNVDEDYGAVSESDVIVTYRDSFPAPRVSQHFPLGVKITQKSYAWESRIKECIFPFEYYVVNKGPYNLDSVYLGLYFFAWVTPRIDPGDKDFYLIHMNDVQSVYFYDRRSPQGPYVGAAFLGATGTAGNVSASMVNLYYRDTIMSDWEKYQLMASGMNSPDVRSPIGALTLFSVGPYQRMHVGDTLKFVIAIIGADGVNAGPNNFRDNAIKARELYKNDWGAPNAPPALPIKVNYENQRVTLDWTWYPGDKAPNPFETWDDSNKFINALPDTHWRRKNPPADHTAGGRVFEGFKIWRSEFPDFKERQFTLLKQFDIDDDLDFNNDNGLQWTYTDTSVVRGRRYWYAVTSFTIPDYIVSTYQIDGRTYSDTVITEPIETGIHENAVSVPIPFAPATKVNEVKVVPNPYRTDRSYQFESGGYEGLTRNWNETKRAIWFIHLPPRATIRVFSLAGELISTIAHDDADRTARNLAIGQEEFELMSDSHRTLASGIYIFTVESDFGKQMGKFVVIR